MILSKKEELYMNTFVVKLNHKLIILFLFIMLTSSSLIVSAKEIKVRIPQFDITINDVKIDNVNRVYPFLIYKDITYFPMTYFDAKFMNLKTGWYSTRDTDVFFVGNSSESCEYNDYYTEIKNSDIFYMAVIPQYKIAVNTVQQNKFIINENEKYPIFNFNNITYFPITWEFAYEQFGWNYTFDSQNGLKIDCRNIVRPEINPDIIGNSVHNYIRFDYVWNDECYAGYPPVTLGEQYEFIWRTRLSAEKKFSLKDEILALKIEYFDSYVDVNGFISEAKTNPIIKDNILRINCVAIENGKYINYILEIDMENEKISRIEKL